MKMRLFSRTAGIVVLITASVFAQVGLQAGVTAGVSMFKQTNSGGGNSVTSDTKNGLVAGGVLDIVIMNLFSVESGIAYEQRGGKWTNDINNIEEKALSYCMLPVHAKLKYRAIPLISPYALAGFNFGLLLSAKNEVTGQSTDIKDGLNPIDFGLDFGAGIELGLPKIVPFVEFVYDLGLSNIDKNAGADNSLTNKGMELKAGVRIKL